MSDMPPRVRVVWMPLALTGSGAPVFPLTQEMDAGAAMRTALELSLSTESQWVRVESVDDRSQCWYAWNGGA